jgi:hypothetical protein
LPLQIDSKMVVMEIDSQVQEIIWAYSQYHNSFKIILETHAIFTGYSESGK